MITSLIFILAVVFTLLAVLTSLLDSLGGVMLSFAQIRTKKSNMPFIFGIISCGLFVWAMIRGFAHIHFSIT